MSTSVDRRTLSEVPDESMISSLREEANENETSIEATYPSSQGQEKRMVVSPRGTVVVLNNVSETTFNRSQSAAEIAASLRE